MSIFFIWFGFLSWETYSASTARSIRRERARNAHALRPQAAVTAPAEPPEPEASASEADLPELVALLRRLVEEREAGPEPHSANGRAATRRAPARR